MTIQTLALVVVILAIVNNTASAETQQITLMCSGVSKRPQPNVPFADPDPRLQQRLSRVTITVSQDDKQVVINGDYYGTIEQFDANEIIFENPKGSPSRSILITLMDGWIG